MDSTRVSAQRGSAGLQARVVRPPE